MSSSRRAEVSARKNVLQAAHAAALGRFQKELRAQLQQVKRTGGDEGRVEKEATGLQDLRDRITALGPHASAAPHLLEMATGVTLQTFHYKYPPRPVKGGEGAEGQGPAKAKGKGSNRKGHSADAAGAMAFIASDKAVRERLDKPSALRKAA